MHDLLASNWVSRHRDAELGYALQTTVEMLALPCSYLAFSQTLAEAFTRVIHDREPETVALFAARDLEPISMRVFRLNGRSAWFKTAPLPVATDELAFAWLTYVHALLLGAPSPAEARAAGPGYDPFANDGGFCNPIKLKLLDEDA